MQSIQHQDSIQNGLHITQIRKENMTKKCAYNIPYNCSREYNDETSHIYGLYLRKKFKDRYNMVGEIIIIQSSFHFHWITY